MPSKPTQLLRTVRARLHPLRVSYVRQKARILPFLLPLRERLGWPVSVPTPAGTVRLVPRGSAALMVLANGRYEMDAMEYLVSRMGAGQVFLDIGANAGLFTLAVARAHPQAKTYAFEPTSGTFALLQENLALNGVTNVRAVRAALSDRNGEAALNVNDPNRDGLNTLLSVSQLPPSRTLPFTVGTETVPTMRLDSFLESEGVGLVSVVKIDVEGAEALVLQGGERLLGQSPCPTIMFEAWADHDQAATQLLMRHGYVVRSLNDEMKVATRPSPDDAGLPD